MKKLKMKKKISTERKKELMEEIFDNYVYIKVGFLNENIKSKYKVL